MSFRDVGAVRIHRLVEMTEMQFGHQEFFPGVAPVEWERHRSWLQPWAWDPKSGRLLLSVQSFLLRTRTCSVLVDTCVGDHKKRRRPDWTMRTGGTLLRALDDLGVSPDSIDYVVCTHMHADHVGWNTRLIDDEWLPTFPNAIYVLARHEWLSWKARHDTSPVDQIQDSILPIIDAGRARFVDDEFEITSEIRLSPTPGHTPGHVSVLVGSEGSRAVITGDVIQHPVQCREPDWISSMDMEPATARATRARMLKEWSEPGLLVCASHFPSPSFGHLVRDGARYDFQRDERGESKAPRVKSVS